MRVRYCGAASSCTRRRDSDRSPASTILLLVGQAVAVLLRLRRCHSQRRAAHAGHRGNDRLTARPADWTASQHRAVRSQQLRLQCTEPATATVGLAGVIWIDVIGFLSSVTVTATSPSTPSTTARMCVVPTCIASTVPKMPFARTVAMASSSLSQVIGPVLPG